MFLMLGNPVMFYFCFFMFGICDLCLFWRWTKKHDNDFSVPKFRKSGNMIVAIMKLIRLSRGLLTHINSSIVDINSIFSWIVGLHKLPLKGASGSLSSHWDQQCYYPAWATFCMISLSRFRMFRWWSSRTWRSISLSRHAIFSAFVL